MAIVGGYQSVEHLVHDFDVHVSLLEYGRTVELLQLFVTLPLAAIARLVVPLFELLDDHGVRLLDHGG